MRYILRVNDETDQQMSLRRFVSSTSVYNTFAHHIYVGTLAICSIACWSQFGANWPRPISRCSACRFFCSVPGTAHEHRKHTCSHHEAMTAWWYDQLAGEQCAGRATGLYVYQTVSVNSDNSPDCSQAGRRQLGDCALPRCTWSFYVVRRKLTDLRQTHDCIMWTSWR